MSEKLDQTLLIALKALLYVHDKRETLTYGIHSNVLDFARNTIDAVEQRPENKNAKINGIPDGWYEPIMTGEVEHPLSLLKAVAAERGQSLFENYKIPEADLQEYFAKTAMADAMENNPRI